MRLVAIGVSHHLTGVGMLGRVVLTEPEARCLVQNLRAAGAREAAAISTCNRTEVYLAGPMPRSSPRSGRGSSPSSSTCRSMSSIPCSTV